MYNEWKSCVSYKIQCIWIRHQPLRIHNAYWIVGYLYELWFEVRFLGLRVILDSISSSSEYFWRWMNSTNDRRIANRQMRFIVESVMGHFILCHLILNQMIAVENSTENIVSNCKSFRAGSFYSRFIGSTTLRIERIHFNRFIFFSLKFLLYIQQCCRNETWNVDCWYIVSM